MSRFKKTNTFIVNIYQEKCRFCGARVERAEVPLSFSSCRQHSKEKLLLHQLTLHPPAAVGQTAEACTTRFYVTTKEESRRHVDPQHILKVTKVGSSARSP